MSRPHVEPGDTVMRLPSGEFEVSRPGSTFTAIYAIHPERLPPPRKSYDDVWGTYRKESTEPTLNDSLKAWREADKQAEDVRKLVGHYFVGNEKYRGRAIRMSPSSSSSSLDNVSIPLDVLFGEGQWADKLLDYARRMDRAADQARWDFVKAAREAFDDWTPDNRPPDLRGLHLDDDTQPTRERDRISIGRPMNLEDDTHER